MATNGEKPAKKGTPDRLLEELQVTVSKPNPPAEVPPRDTDKADSGISAESIKSEREEDALIDKNIEARKAAGAVAAPEAVAPEGEQIAGSLVGKFNTFVAAEHSTKNESPITPAVTKAIPPELEHLSPEERKTYEKISAEKRESYLAHVTEMRADKEKKERKSNNKKSVNPRSQKPKATNAEVKPPQARIIGHGELGEMKEGHHIGSAPEMGDTLEPADERLKEFREAEAEAEGYKGIEKKVDERTKAEAVAKTGKVEAPIVPNPAEVGPDDRIESTLGAVPEQPVESVKERKFNPDGSEYIDFVDIPPKEGTPKEWRKKLKDTILQFGQNVAGDIKTAGKGVAYVVTNPLESLRAVRTGAERAMGYTKYFMDRNISLNDKGEKLGMDLKALTEGYNKLPFRQKAYITAALIGGSSLAAATALPALSSTLAGLMYGQRALGGAGFALNRRKGMEARIAKDPEHWLADKSDTFKNTYAVVLGGAYLGVSAMAGRYATEKVTEWLGNLFGHGTAVATEVAGPPSGAGAIPHAAEAPVVAAPAHAPEVATTPTPTPTPAAVAAAGEATVSAQMPEISVGASSHGYEGMLKDLIKQLPDKPPEGVTPKIDGNDIEKLFYAKLHPENISGAIHRLATDNDFFTKQGNALIDKSAHMTIVNGNIQFTDAAHPTGIFKAAADMHFTASPHPEAPVAASQAPTLQTIASAPHAEVVTTQTVSPTSAEYAPVHRPISAEPPVAPIASAAELLPSQNVPAAEAVKEVDITHAQDIHQQETAPNAMTQPDTSPSHEMPAAPEASANFTLNKLGLPVDIAQAETYFTPKGDVVIFGGSLSSESMAEKATDIVSKDHSAVVYYETTQPRNISNLWQSVTQINKASWVERSGSFMPVDEEGTIPGAATDIQVGEVEIINDTQVPELKGIKAPGIDDLKELYKPGIGKH